jgi:DNA (cytosine-5)-methyltransferase 1
MKSPDSEKLRIASLFCGAGGLDLGFKRAGFEIVWANDNDSDAVLSYKKNVGAHCVLADIEKINVKEIPKVDGIIGGFPCQGFSVANTQRAVDDSRNTLYKSFVKAVKVGQPKFFLAENVKGILSLGQGHVFKHILNDFEKAGYNCTYALVNAADYGVPQNRQRVLILGIRKDIEIIDLVWPPPPSHKDRQIPVGAALASVPDPDEPNTLKNHVYSQFKLKFNGYISNRAVNPNKPSPTITARGDHKGGAMIIHHPSNTRRMTCREVAIVQGFPNSFEFVGSMTSVYKQIGNAVPPPLAQAAAKQILKLLSST